MLLYERKGVVFLLPGKYNCACSISLTPLPSDIMYFSAGETPTCSHAGRGRSRSLGRYFLFRPSR